MKIMIVDDQPFYSGYLADELKSQGYLTELVRQADEVLVRIDEDPPDLVLLDLYLDGFEGFGVLRDIKSRHPLLPVIIVSAYDSFVGDPRAEKADGYFIKDINTSRIKEEIVNFFQNNQSKLNLTEKQI